MSQINKASLLQRIQVGIIAYFFSLMSSYLAPRPRLLFSFPGKPPVLTGSTSINDMSQDEGTLFRKFYDYIGGAKATKRAIEAKVKDIIGPLEWNQDDLDEPLDLGKFFGEIAKLHVGQRCSLLCWFQALSEGNEVHTDPKTVTLTRTAYFPDPNAPSAAYIRAAGNARQKQQDIENTLAWYDGEAHRQAAEVALKKGAAEVSKNTTHVLIPKSKPTGPIFGRSLDDLILWNKVFQHIDATGSGTVSKALVQKTLAPAVGAFPWDDDDDETPLTFSQFVDVMTSTTPIENRHTVLRWARTECPDKVFPEDGGAAFFTTAYIVKHVPARPVGRSFR